MREIKFRGKRIDNGEWIYGGYHKNDSGRVFIAIGSYLEKVHFCLVEVIPETVGQLTGLKDKNDNKVYEEDIAQPYSGGVKTIPLLIMYLENAYVMGDGYETSRLDCIWYYEYEIIGNIHENPELLK